MERSQGVSGFLQQHVYRNEHGQRTISVYDAMKDGFCAVDALAYALQRAGFTNVDNAAVREKLESVKRSTRTDGWYDSDEVADAAALFGVARLVILQEDAVVGDSGTPTSGDYSLLIYHTAHADHQKIVGLLQRDAHYYAVVPCGTGSTEVNFASQPAIVLLEKTPDNSAFDRIDVIRNVDQMYKDTAWSADNDRLDTTDIEATEEIALTVEEVAAVESEAGVVKRTHTLSVEEENRQEDRMVSTVVQQGRVSRTLRPINIKLESVENMISVVDLAGFFRVAVDFMNLEYPDWLHSDERIFIPPLFDPKYPFKRDYFAYRDKNLGDNSGIRGVSSEREVYDFFRELFEKMQTAAFIIHGGSTEPNDWFPEDVRCLIVCDLIVVTKQCVLLAEVKSGSQKNVARQQLYRHTEELKRVNRLCCAAAGTTMATPIRRIATVSFYNIDRATKSDERTAAGQPRPPEDDPRRPVEHIDANNINDYAFRKLNQDLGYAADVWWKTVVDGAEMLDEGEEPNGDRSQERSFPTALPFLVAMKSFVSDASPCLSYDLLRLREVAEKQIRNIKQCFGETSLEGLYCIFLTKRQLALWHNTAKQIITGAPGSGKTILMKLKALERLLAGRRVVMLIPAAMVANYKAFFFAELHDRREDPAERKQLHSRLLILSMGSCFDWSRPQGRGLSFALEGGLESMPESVIEALDDCDLFIDELQCLLQISLRKWKHVGTDDVTNADFIAALERLQRLIAKLTKAATSMHWYAYNPWAAIGALITTDLRDPSDAPTMARTIVGKRGVKRDTTEEHELLIAMLTTLIEKQQFENCVLDLSIRSTCNIMHLLNHCVPAFHLTSIFSSNFKCKPGHGIYGPKIRFVHRAPATLTADAGLRGVESEKKRTEQRLRLQAFVCAAVEREITHYESVGVSAKQIAVIEVPPLVADVTLIRRFLLRHRFGLVHASAPADPSTWGPTMNASEPTVRKHIIEALESLSSYACLEVDDEAETASFAYAAQTLSHEWRAVVLIVCAETAQGNEDVFCFNAAYRQIFTALSRSLYYASVIVPIGNMPMFTELDGRPCRRCTSRCVELVSASIDNEEEVYGDVCKLDDSLQLYRHPNVMYAWADLFIDVSIDSFKNLAETFASLRLDATEKQTYLDLLIDDSPLADHTMWGKHIAENFNQFVSDDYRLKMIPSIRLCCTIMHGVPVLQSEFREKLNAPGVVDATLQHGTLVARDLTDIAAMVRSCIADAFSSLLDGNMLDVLKSLVFLVEQIKRHNAVRGVWKMIVELERTLLVCGLYDKERQDRPSALGAKLNVVLCDFLRQVNALDQQTKSLATKLQIKLDFSENADDVEGVRKANVHILSQGYSTAEGTEREAASDNNDTNGGFKKLLESLGIAASTASRNYTYHIFFSEMSKTWVTLHQIVKLCNNFADELNAFVETAVIKQQLTSTIGQAGAQAGSRLFNTFFGWQQRACGKLGYLCHAVGFLSTATDEARRLGVRQRNKSPLLAKVIKKLDADILLMKKILAAMFVALGLKFNEVSRQRILDETPSGILLDEELISYMSGLSGHLPRFVIPHGEAPPLAKAAETERNDGSAKEIDADAGQVAVPRAVQSCIQQ